MASEAAFKEALELDSCNTVAAMCLWRMEVGQLESGEAQKARLLEEGLQAFRASGAGNTPVATSLLNELLKQVPGSFVLQRLSKAS